MAPVAPPHIAHARSADHARTLDAGTSRWLILLGIPFIVGGALFATAIATDKMWMLLPAAIFGPGAMILGFTYLALSHDGNRVA